MTTKMNILLLAPLLPLLFDSCDCQEVETQFSYLAGSSNGPERWGQLLPEWRACGDGKSQSPVDLPRPGSVAMAPNLGTLQRKYNPAQAVLNNRGHGIMVAWNGDAGSVVINGTTYNLKQLHFHTPSEHTIDGANFDMEMHMVHMSDTNATAVIGVLYKFGEPDAFLTELDRGLKLLGSTKTVDLGVLDPSNAKINDDKSYYRYVRTVSSAQVQALQKPVDAGFQANARPIQPLNNRTAMKDGMIASFFKLWSGMLRGQFKNCNGRKFS